MAPPEHPDSLREPLWPDELPVLPHGCIVKGRGRPKITRTRRWAIYARDGWECVVCGRRPGDHAEEVNVGRTSPMPPFRVHLTLDHRYPLAAGGCSHPHNLRTLCNQCNSRKGSIA